MHPHDANWVREQLLRLTPDLRKPTQVNYERVYAEALADAATREPRESQQITEARRVANTRLRKFIDKVTQKNDRLT